MEKSFECDDAISRNAVIQTLNKMDRYTATELTLCDTNKKFPANEVFIVDDVYEQIAEQLPSVTHKPIECDDAINRPRVVKFEGTNMACMGGDEIMKEFENNPQQNNDKATCDDAISRQAVLDRIRESIETYHNQYTTDMLNMWGLFTQFIKEMPSVRPQEPIDAISREAVIEWLKAKDIIKLSSQEETARKELKALPPVTPQKYGHWIWNFDKGYCKCSECGIGMGHKEFDYCPNCGAKMQESEEDACKDCYYNDGEVHAECVVCEKAESEVRNEV